MSKFEILPIKWEEVRDRLGDCEIGADRKTLALQVCLESGSVFYVVGGMSVSECHIFTDTEPKDDEGLGILCESIQSCGCKELKAGENVMLFHCKECGAYDKDAMREALKIIITRFAYLCE